MVARAQSFNSGPTGVDGALVLTEPGTIVFDPRTFKPPLNPSLDDVYRFTSVYIGKDVTVKLSANLLHSPVFWLSQGPVQIDGTIDLNGADGDLGPSLAGAGGYPGGAARNPGYGRAGFTANAFLVPLVGGMGGDGGEMQGGGAGGGALLIASSTSITINGSITANGGNSFDGSGGGGGAIRLVAPVIYGINGALSAKGGKLGGTDGRIRFEALDNRFVGNLNETPFAQGKPFGLFLPPNPPPTARVVSLGGVSLTKPEFEINYSSPLRVVVEAHFVPIGTAMELEFLSENGLSQSVTTTPLVGTFESSTATATITFSPGRSRGYVTATWKQLPLK
jgi:hypothetical protein